jgi:hypothetical protein
VKRRRATGSGVSETSLSVASSRTVLITTAISY